MKRKIRILIAVLGTVGLITFTAGVTWLLIEVIKDIYDLTGIIPLSLMGIGSFLVMIADYLLQKNKKE